MSEHTMAQQRIDWREVQMEPIPTDRPVLVAMPLHDGDACYAAAYINEDGDLESLCGGEISFPVTHWATLTPPKT